MCPFRVRKISPFKILSNRMIAFDQIYNSAQKFTSIFTLFAIVLFWLQGSENGSAVTTAGETSGPRPLSVPDVDKLQLPHEPRIDSYRFSMANLEGKFLCLIYIFLNSS